jgi:16S rRNA (adenine1518-N6/adenine1519-N6)-dimethyltransferase
MQNTKYKFHKAKKSLGQNFLKSIPALNKIIEAGEISAEDIILEIGPGKGVLTKKLLEKAKKVIAVEKDEELFNLLQKKFSEEIKAEKLILINGDILDFEKNNILQEFSYKIIANIPYNITGAILKKFLTEKSQPSLMVLMVQHEVAKRIIGQEKTSSTAPKIKESLLSISVKAYGQPKIIMKVPARYFSPAPKVDSAIISIKNISRKFFIENKIVEEKFWEIIHAGFQHKRKKLSSNLKNVQKKYSINLKKELGDKRAEDLSLENWTLLTK